MLLSEFDAKFVGVGMKHKVTIICDECGLPRTINKEKARQNIVDNGKSICRACSMTLHHQECPPTDETKSKISEKLMGIVRSDETKKKMSEARLAFFQTPAGLAQKAMLSALAAKGHAENKFENSKRNGWYESTKVGKVFYASSYELLFCVELDDRDDVQTYQTQIAYTYEGRGRCLDFLVTYTDGRKEAIEIKPLDRLAEQANVDQINDSSMNAIAEGWEFDFYTEDHFGMTATEIRDWADKFLTATGPFDFVAFRKERARARALKHYHGTIANDKVQVYCEFCKENHTPLRKTYLKAVEKNGRFICEREGGSISGRKPKPKKVNPYAAEGKKQCLGVCGKVLEYAMFGADKSRSDGYADKCKQCRATKAKETYDAKQMVQKPEKQA
jgi:hypothetical protein